MVEKFNRQFHSRDNRDLTGRGKGGWGSIPGLGSIKNKELSPAHLNKENITTSANISLFPNALFPVPFFSDLFRLSFYTAWSRWSFHAFFTRLIHYAHFVPVYQVILARTYWGSVQKKTYIWLDQTQAKQP